MSSAVLVHTNGWGPWFQVSIQARMSASRAWTLSTDPQFIDKVRDIVGLYLNPPQAALVLCVDERPRCRRWTAPLRSSRCCQAPRSGPPMSMSATGHQPVRRPGRRRGQGHHRSDRTTPRHRVPPLSGPHRPRRSARSCCARDLRQLLHSQDPGDPAVADCPPAVPAALHPDLQLLAEPGRALHRRVDHQVASTWYPPLGG
jgi:hypothetical protein